MKITYMLWGGVKEKFIYTMQYCAAIRKDDSP